MTEPAPLTDFERRLVDALSMHAEVARDPRPTRHVAADAMRLGRRRQRVLSWPRLRLLGLAALLLLPLALAVAGAAVLLRTELDDAVRALVVRPAGAGLYVLVVEPDGHERLVRKVTGQSLGLGPGYVLQRAGSLGPSGWLVVHADSAAMRDYRWSRTVFIDLADPATPPIILPSNGFVGPRWGPDGRASLVCGPAPDCGLPSGGDESLPRFVRVLGLEDGSETIVAGVPLHGGTPEQIWTADGSGFLAGSDLDGWDVKPLDGGPVVEGTPELFSRRYRLDSLRPDDPALLVEAADVGRRWLGGALAPATPVDGLNAADGESIWMLLDGSVDREHAAILIRLTGPGQIAAVHRLEVPVPVTRLTLSDDDVAAAFGLGDAEPWPFALATVGDDGVATVAGPAIDGLLLGLVPAAEADTWPSH